METSPWCQQALSKALAGILVTIGLVLTKRRGESGEKLDLNQIRAPAFVDLNSKTGIFPESLKRPAPIT